MTLFSSGGGLGTFVEESTGEEGYVVLLLKRNLGCDLRVSRTFGAPPYSSYIEENNIFLSVGD